MQYLKADTAITLKIGPFVDDTDGKTAETGLTITQAEVRLSKNGGDIAQKNEATNCTHDELGVYGCPIDTTDTNTEGRLQLWVHESGALPVFHEYMVVNANVYDSLFAAATTDYLQVDTIQVTGTGQTANDNGADINTLITQVGTAGDGLTGVPWNASWDAEVESEVNDALVALNLDHLMKTATAAADMTTEIADNTALSRILSNGDTSAFVPSTDGLQLIRDKETDIETDTAEIGAAGAGLSAVPWNASWDAEVESEVDDALGGGTGTALTAIPWNANWDTEIESEVNDALVALNLDHLMKTAVANNADMTTEVADGTVLSNIMTSDSDTSGYTVADDSLEGISDSGGGDATSSNQTTIINHLTDVKGTGFAKDTHSLTDILGDTDELREDWTNGGRLDLLLDAVKAVTDDMKVLDTTIASVDTTDTIFVLTAGLTSNDDINNAVCSFYDNTGSIWSGPRKVDDWVNATKTLTVDTDVGFPVQAGDRVIIWNVSYATTAAAGSVTQANINAIADQVWDEAEADHVTEGSMGDKQRRSDRVGR